MSDRKISVLGQEIAIDLDGVNVTDVIVIARVMDAQGNWGISLGFDPQTDPTILTGMMTRGGFIVTKCVNEAPEVEQ